MQLQKVQAIRIQALQTALSTFEDGRLGPICTSLHAVGMAAFGEEIKILSAIADGLTNQLLAVVITFRGVDHVQPGVEGAVQQIGDRLSGRALIPNLRSAESENGNVHIGFTETPLF